MNVRIVCRVGAALSFLPLLIASAGCHQVRIDTGLQPGETVYEQEWNMAFAFAIFPAQVDASEYCGGRWARVETKQSFLNWVVSALTWNIISPMESRVVCAQRGSPGAGDADEVTDAAADVEGQPR